MIQRIQSVYLFAACVVLEVSAWVLYALPGAVLTGYRIPLVVAVGITGLAGLWAVFLYKKRAVQLKVVRAVGSISLVLLLLILGAFYLSGDMGTLLAKGTYGVLLGLFVPLILAVSFFYRAAKAIKRDIDLIRSMDRLR